MKNTKKETASPLGLHIAKKMNMNFDDFMKLYDNDFLFKHNIDKAIVKMSEDMKVKHPELYNQIFA